MRPRFKKIFVERNCFISLVASSIEVYPRETTGILIGKIAERKIQKKKSEMTILQTAYPIQTASRKFTEVDPLENRRAFLRAFNSIVAIPSFDIVGEYHSHPDEPADISDDDFGYISERLDDIYQNEELLLEYPRWLEIVLRVSKKDYTRQIDSGWSYSDYSRKARCVVRITPDKGFDFTFGAFWIYRDGNRMRKRETDVYIPWTSSRHWV